MFKRQCLLSDLKAGDLVGDGSLGEIGRKCRIRDRLANRDLRHGLIAHVAARSLAMRKDVAMIEAAQRIVAVGFGSGYGYF
jgi:hypothetical protein